ncbi:cytochrome P450 [Fischerella thermalis CCMEE 5273]|nr:cytochrome P450 [Fischerella thermalis CCMEE 5273]
MASDVRFNPLYPFSWYQHMLTHHPIYYHKKQKQWHLFRYQDVKEALRNHQLFQQDAREETSSPLESSLVMLSPPKHGQMRSLISQAFTPKAVQQLQPRIREIARTLLEEVKESGSMDLVESFSYPLPVIVIAELLGIPKEDREQFKKWSDHIVESTELDDLDMSDASGRIWKWPKKAVRQIRIIQRFRRAEKEMGAYFLEIIRERKKNPKADLISQLIRAEVEGEKLTDFELLGFCMLLLIAGNETTTNLINNVVLCMDQFPHVQEHVAQHPTDIRKVVEETLRYRAPVPTLSRIAGEDVDVRGYRIKKGERVILWLGAANHDSTQFPRPHDFNWNRTNHKHMAFGHGIHFCLGAPLARLEAEIALRELFLHCSHIRIQSNAKLQPNIMHSVDRLPVLFYRRQAPCERI